MKAHFLDIDTILSIDNKVWVVDKRSPNIPIMKTSKSDFNLIKSGIYKSQGNKIEFNGVVFWLPNSMMDNLKIKCKNSKVDISNLSISMQEFLNPDVVDNINYTINMENIQHIKNTPDDVYIICSKNSKRNYESIIKKIEDKLKETGLSIKNYYFISETFYDRNEDDIAYNKVKLMLQHLVGYKASGNSFTNEEITKYDEVYFYDDDLSAIKLAKDCNSIFQSIIDKTPVDVKSVIKESIKNKTNTLVVNQVTSNKYNRFLTDRIELKWSNLVKFFERFNWKG